MAENRPEVWLRGPVEGVPALSQPAAHALLQSAEEAERIMDGLPDELLWKRPAGLASPAFHLQHLSGVVDRMATYAKGLPLSEEQLSYLSMEGTEVEVKGKELVLQFRELVEKIVEQLKATDLAVLTEYRAVGRKKLPSTVIGLLFHAAGHSQRHIGQLLVTVRVLMSEPGGKK
jgi:uncharacterized damage-inducible protein DinB